MGARSDPSFQTRPIQGAIRLVATSAVATRPLDVAPAVRFAQILLKKCAAIRVSMPLAHLARTGFFKPVHVKSLSGHALRSLIIARKKLVGQRVTLENRILGLALRFVLIAQEFGRERAPVVFGWCFAAHQLARARWLSRRASRATCSLPIPGVPRRWRALHRRDHVLQSSAQPAGAGGARDRRIGRERLRRRILSGERRMRVSARKQGN